MDDQQTPNLEEMDEQKARSFLEELFTVLIVELKDGKWWRDTRYYAEPFEAPEWRAQWVESMESQV
jgi:hypothetical protein